MAIKKDVLKVFSYPTENFFSFINESKLCYLIGSNSFWHNGIHFRANSALRPIYNAEVIAMRIADNYKNSYTFDEFPMVYRTSYLEKSFTDEFDELFDLNNGLYKLKTGLDDNQKQKAFYLVNELFSNSFILLKHSVKNYANKDIIFYSLYNHLKPISKMSLEQRAGLFYFEKQLKLKQFDGYYYIESYEDPYDKTKISKVPCETLLTESDLEEIKWTYNGEKYKGVINKSFVRQLSTKEIRRPLRTDEENNTSSEYLDKKNPPAELVLDSNMVIIYTTNNVDDRQSKASVTKNSRLRISNKNNFETFITSPSSKTGFEVEYEINNITEKGFIFIDSLDINDVTQKYKSWKNKNDSSNSEYYYCAEKGIYDGENLIVDKAFTLNSYKIKINHVVKIKEDNTEEDKGSGYILCETCVEVKDDSDLKCYSWTLNNENYNTFIETKYIRNNFDDKHLETKRYPRSEEEKKNPTTYLPVEYNKKESNCILLYTTESSDNRFAKTVVASNTIFYISNENIISNYLNNYDKKKGLEVSYKNSDGKIQSGYLYIDSLNEKTAEKNNADKIKEDYNKWIKSIPNNTEETKSFENIFELSVKLKDGISVNNVIAPAEKELRRDSIVGYAGYTITSEESEDVWENDDATTIHFEIFTNDCEFMKYKEGTPCSCILKVNSECKLQKGKLKTVTSKRNLKFLPLIKEYNEHMTSSDVTKLLSYENNSYKNGILRLLDYIKLVDGEEFYEMKFIGKVSQLLSDEYVERDECFTEWDGTSSTWKGKADLQAAKIYTKDGVMKSGKTIKIYKKLRYNWLNPTGGTVVKDGKKLELRKAAYFYEYFDKSNESRNFYIRKEIFTRLKSLDTTNKEYYMESDQSILFKDILDMPTEVEWSGGSITKKEGNLIFKGKTLKQYTNAPTIIWEAVGLENSTEEYWVSQRDISEREGNKPLEKIIFDKWDNFFKEIDLTSIGQYKGKLEDKETLEGLKLNSQIINDYETEKKGRLGTTEQFTVSDYLNSSGYINNYYFKNMTEWNNDSGLTDELCKTTQLKEKIKTQRKETAFWQEASSLKDFPKASEDKYYFFHPVTFLQHLDKVVTLAEFNPYEGATVAYYASPQDRKNKKLSYYTVKDNPGFAPLYNDYESYEYEGMGRFGRVTGSFNEDYQYLDSYKNRFSEFYHEGLDLRGKTGTPVKALILCKVIAYGWYSTYGQVVFLSKKNDVGIYMIAHLSEYDSDIYVGKEYLPGETVGYVGASGKKKDGKYDLNAWENPHLHITYYDYEYLENKIVNSDNGEILFKGNIQSILINSRSNPFKHDSEKRKPNKELKSNMV